MRGHFLNYRAVGRLLLFLIIAIAVIVTADWLIRHCHRSLPSASRNSTSAYGTALQQQLARCQAIGAAAQSDHACIATWIENRRRFFGDAP